MVTPDLQDSFEKLNRRSFLLKSLAVTGTAVALGACGEEQPLPPPAGIKHLGGKEALILQKAADVLIPAAGTPFTAPGAVPLLQNIDIILDALPAAFRGDLMDGLSLFNSASVIVGFHFTRFVNLSLEDATQYCLSWESGMALQQALMGAIKKTVYISYWADAKTWPAINYGGPVSKQRGLKRLGNAPRRA